MHNLLVIKYLLTGDTADLFTRMQIFGVETALVFIAVFIDFIVGIRRSRRLGIPYTSSRYRRTVSKISQYAVFLLFGFLLDEFVYIYVSFPVVSGIFSVFLIFIEGHSVWESFSMNDRKNYKERFQDFGEIINTIRTQDLKQIADELNEKIKNEEIKNNTDGSDN